MEWSGVLQTTLTTLPAAGIAAFMTLLGFWLADRRQKRKEKRDAEVRQKAADEKTEAWRTEVNLWRNGVDLRMEILNEGFGNQRAIMEKVNKLYTISEVTVAKLTALNDLMESEVGSLRSDFKSVVRRVTQIESNGRG